MASHTGDKVFGIKVRTTQGVGGVKFVIRIINEQNKGFGNLTNSPLEILTKTTF